MINEHNEEEIVVKYLMSKGYDILEMDFKDRESSNVIANDKDVLTFIQVRMKDGIKYKYNNELIDSRKQKEMANKTLQYIINQKTNFRYDLIEIFPMEKNRIRHFEDVLSLD